MFSDPFGLCPNPPCFEVIGDSKFHGTWDKTVSQSPTLQKLVAQSSDASSPIHRLVQNSGSGVPYGFPGGVTDFFGPRGADGVAKHLNVQKPNFRPDIYAMTSTVFMADLSNPGVVAGLQAKGKVATLENIQVHEFGHGPSGRKFDFSEAGANKIECKVMSETGGKC